MTVSTSVDNNRQRKPRILLLADKPGWAFDFAARAIAKHLAGAFDFRIEYVGEKPDLNRWQFDIIYVFWWGETYHQTFIDEPERVIKDVTSHRWALEEKFGPLTTAQLVEKHLADAGTVTAVSLRLQRMISPYREVLLAPEGFESQNFFSSGERQGSLKIGWAGNVKDKCKGVKDILRPAVFPRFRLRKAGGDFDHSEMLNFYRSIDVICVASTAEGQPLPLVEAMACGCFPVAVDVGIVPELVKHRENGLIVERNASAFRRAFKWCRMNLAEVRRTGETNAELVLATRTWEKTIGYWEEIFWRTLKLNGWNPPEKITLGGHLDEKTRK